MKLPETELDRERLNTQRLVNGWLAVSLVVFTTWSITEAVIFIGGLF
jgi:hypothetical protein